MVCYVTVWIERLYKELLFSGQFYKKEEMSSLINLTGRVLRVTDLGSVDRFGSVLMEYDVQVSLSFRSKGRNGVNNTPRDGFRPLGVVPVFEFTGVPGPSLKWSHFVRPDSRIRVQTHSSPLTPVDPFLSVTSQGRADDGTRLCPVHTGPETYKKSIRSLRRHDVF